VTTLPVHGVRHVASRHGVFRVATIHGQVCSGGCFLLQHSGGKWLGGGGGMSPLFL
jgi:hypothetical protein